MESEKSAQPSTEKSGKARHAADSKKPKHLKSKQPKHGDSARHATSAFHFFHASEPKQEQMQAEPIVPKRHWKLRIAILILILLAVVFTILRLSDLSHFVTTFYEIEDSKIENPMRIVLLTDLHLQEFGENNSELVVAIQKLEPDLIAMAGDMINDDNADESVVRELCAQLIDVAPIYYSYGNHELYVTRVAQTSTLGEDLEALGVHVLHNRYETIEVNGNVIDIGGLSTSPTLFESEENTQLFYEKFMQAENYRILLCHHPNYFFEGGALVGSGIDLALCGHLHGGQVIIPYVGGLYHPSTGLLPEMYNGCHDVEGTNVVISCGLGNGKWFPRINNPPELVVVDLY